MNIRSAVVVGEKIEGITSKRSFVMYSELSEDDKKLWLVHGLLGQGEASAVYGQPGCGKSVLVEDMALHIAAGRDWLGRPGRRGAVVYVALERKKAC
jgi:RecA-family ATPase